MNIFTKINKIFPMALLVAAMLLGGCRASQKEEESSSTEEIQTIAESSLESVEASGATEDKKDAAILADGVYQVDFDTDSSMFHVSEACDGKGTLTVTDGEMMLHISLGSKKILNLYPGTAAEAAEDQEGWLQPTEDTVTYSDGLTEEVYGFDVPVSVIGEEFDLALVGTKGTWYDHKVVVSNPQPAEGVSTEALTDGSYMIELTFEGGSGKAQIISPATITVAEGKMTATVEWNSANYDYMLVDGEKYLPVNTEGNSVFEIPVSALDTPLTVIGDTVAMSKPHEIEYTLTFHSETAQAIEN